MCFSKCFPDPHNIQNDDDIFARFGPMPRPLELAEQYLFYLNEANEHYEFTVVLLEDCFEVFRDRHPDIGAEAVLTLLNALVDNEVITLGLDPRENRVTLSYRIYALFKIRNRTICEQLLFDFD
jgi:hypothetical protein